MPRPESPREGKGAAGRKSAPARAGSPKEVTIRVRWLEDHGLWTVQVPIGGGRRFTLFDFDHPITALERALKVAEEELIRLAGQQRLSAP